MLQNDWIESVRGHFAIAAVGGSTLMSQSGEGRVDRARLFLLKHMPLANLASLSADEFAQALNAKTTALAKDLPRPDDGKPNWGAARKVLNIYLRMCVMNKDLHPAFKLAAVEPFLEVPLDRQVVAKLDAAGGTKHAKTFKIKTLSPALSAELQANALAVSKRKGRHRYELDVLYWNQQPDA
ncbi:hypothetical protein ACS5PN_30540 [Roseateles sp. NT4]|uniref:hypothetical protein n=1 Tax=Roseateles sp. NT4 TaxID=3453715 RepID=UPI003EEF57A0